MTKSAKFLAYLGAAFFFFLFFLFSTFPTDVLENRIIGQIEESLGNNYQLKIQSSSIGLLTGFSFKNVELNQKVDLKDVSLIKAQKLKINFSILSFLRKKIKISFYAKVNKGTLEGDFFDDATESDLDLSFDDFNLSELQSLSALYNLKLSGLINGDASAIFSKKNIDKNNGKINLTFQNLKLDSYKIVLDPNSPEATLDLPKINLTGSKNSKLIGELKKDKLEIKELTFKGGDLDLSLKGNLKIADRADISEVNLEGNLRIAPLLSQAISLLALVEQQKEPDGSYRLKISGRLTKPSITLGNFRLPL